MSDGLTKALWEYLDRNRGSVPAGKLLRGWLEEVADANQRRERLLVWLATVGAGHSREAGEFLSTAAVASFIADLAVLGGASSVLDPACGAGLLLSFAADQSGAPVVHGIERNVDVAEMARLLIPEPAKIFQGDTLTGDFALASKYDLIISEPPFNARLQKEYPSPYGGAPLTDVGNAILCWSASKLSPHGRAVFLLPASCLSSRGKRLWRNLSSHGVHLRAMIHVPSGQLKSTSAESYVAVMERFARDKVFTAQFATDQALQKQILENYESHRAGNRPAQGRLVDMTDYRGFRALDASERLEEHARRAGLKAVRMKDLVIECEVLTSATEPVEGASNDLYLSLSGRCEASLSPPEITDRFKPAKVARLVVNGDLADVRFVAASMNDEVGRLFLESVSVPSNFIQRVDERALMEATFHLPPRDVQTKVLEASSKLHALRAELDEIESTLRSHPTHVEKQIRQLRRVNHEDSLESWLESIPFPLASILWRFRASNESTKEKNDILLHFFEALAEFWATIYLSAAKSDREFWADHVSGLTEAVENGKLSFDQATFGLWKCVIESLSKKFRHLLDQDADRCSAMFGTPSRDVLQMLFDRRMLTLLQTANSIRNQHAHGGVPSPREIGMVHEQLTDLVQTCRSVMGATWERYELVQPGECRYAGGVFHYKVRRIMGTRTPFASADRKTIEGMDDGSLQLLDPEGERSLPLLAFVRVMPSPKTEANACYFYNKRQPRYQTFVSYHFEADSEVERFFADTQAALEGLRPFKPNATL